MRRTLIASAFAVAALGVAGGVVVSAGGSGAVVAAPTTTFPDLDFLSDIGFTEEQIECLVEQVGPIDSSDPLSVVGVLGECGLSLDQFLQIGQGTSIDSTLPGEPALPAEPATSAVEPVAPSAVEPVAPIDIDAGTAAAVLSLLGLDQADVDCVVSEAELVAPTDDASAESVFVACGVGLLQVLEAIVALDERTETPEMVPDVSATTGNDILNFVIEQLAATGIADAEQLECVFENLSEFDPSDFTGLFEDCGIDIAGPISGG